MSWVAVGAAAVGVVGSAVSSSAAKSAANTQAGAAKDAAGASQAQFEETRQDQAPWRTAGAAALGKLQYGLGIGGTAGGGVAQTPENFDSNAYYAANPDVLAGFHADNGGLNQSQYAIYHYNNFGQNEGRAFTYTPQAQAQMQSNTTGSSASGTGYGDLLRNFSMADYQADPGYAFRQSQGEKAINSAALAKGRYNSGATIKSLDDFNSGLASQEYGNAFNRFQTQQQNQYNRLAGVAGVGQQATNFTDSAGANSTANQNAYLTSGAAASAAGTIGSANAYVNAANSGLNYWQGQTYINALKPKTTSNPYMGGNDFQGGGL